MKGTRFFVSVDPVSGDIVAGVHEGEVDAIKEVNGKMVCRTIPVGRAFRFAQTGVSVERLDEDETTIEDRYAALEESVMRKEILNGKDVLWKNEELVLWQYNSSELPTSPS